MSQIVKVDRRLDFYDVASHGDNIYGNPSFNKVVLYDDFLGDAIDGAWGVNSTSDGDFALVAGIGGTLQCTTNSTTNHFSTLVHELNWSATKQAVFEARLMANTITNCKIEVGFNDVKTDGGMATCNVALTTLSHVAHDLAMFSFDTLASAGTWYFCTNKAGGADLATQIVTANIASNVMQTFRIELDSSGNVTGFIDGVSVGHATTAITAADPLTPWIAVRNRGLKNHKVTVDYVKCWQDR